MESDLWKTRPQLRTRTQGVRCACQVNWATRTHSPVANGNGIKPYATTNRFFLSQQQEHILWLTKSPNGSIKKKKNTILFCYVVRHEDTKTNVWWRQPQTRRHRSNFRSFTTCHTDTRVKIVSHRWMKLSKNKYFNFAKGSDHTIFSSWRQTHHSNLCRETHDIVPGKAQYVWQVEEKVDEATASRRQVGLGEKDADEEALGDGGHTEDQQEDEDHWGVTVLQHFAILRGRQRQLLVKIKQIKVWGWQVVLKELWLSVLIFGFKQAEKKSFQTQLKTNCTFFSCLSHNFFFHFFFFFVFACVKGTFSNFGKQHSSVNRHHNSHAQFTETFEKISGGYSGEYFRLRHNFIWKSLRGRYCTTLYTCSLLSAITATLAKISMGSTLNHRWITFRIRVRRNELSASIVMQDTAQLSQCVELLRPMITAVSLSLASFSATMALTIMATE